MKRPLRTYVIRCAPDARALRPAPRFLDGLGAEAELEGAAHFSGRTAAVAFVRRIGCDSRWKPALLEDALAEWRAREAKRVEIAEAVAERHRALERAMENEKEGHS